MMDIKETSVIIAGATGLVGSHLLSELQHHAAISHIYALTRSPLHGDRIEKEALTNIVHPELEITNWQEGFPKPEVGFICLGTTVKQAGSKKGLEKVDFDLVCHVAQAMKVLGVKRISVISSYGANDRSWSHYLRVKGRMENALIKMGFDQLSIMRPGPITGKRKVTRIDEVITHKLLTFFSWFLFWGPLNNLTPIQAKDISLAMLYRSFENDFHRVEILDTRAIKAQVSVYQ